MRRRGQDKRRDRKKKIKMEREIKGSVSQVMRAHAGFNMYLDSTV